MSSLLVTVSLLHAGSHAASLLLLPGSMASAGDLLSELLIALAPGSLSLAQGGQTQCKKFPRLLIYRMFLRVRLGSIGIYCLKCSLAAVNAAPQASRPLDTTPLEPLQLKTIWRISKHKRRCGRNPAITSTTTTTQSGRFDCQTFKTVCLQPKWLRNG